MSSPLENLQQNISEELMASWKHGCRDGLTMASRMAGGVLAEVERHLQQPLDAQGMAVCQAQIAVLRAMQSSFVAAAEDEELA